MFEIVKVVIRGEMPKICEECPVYKEYEHCPFLKFVPNIPRVVFRLQFTKDAWCPLVLESESEE